MSAEPLAFLLLILFGGWTALDGTSFGQFMISRPVVAASIAGWIVGAPAAGAMLGLLLEALHLMVLPVGAARYPEGGPAAVAGAGAYAAGIATAPALLTAVVFVLLWEHLSGESVRQLRKLNMVLATPPAERVLSPARLERRHLGAVALDFLRGGVVTAAGLLVLTLSLNLVEAHWAVGDRLPRLVLGAALLAALAAAVRLFDSPRQPRLVVIGAACGALVALLR